MVHQSATSAPYDSAYSRYTYGSPVERHILRGSPEGSARRCPPPRPWAVGRHAFTSWSMKATSH